MFRKQSMMLKGFWNSKFQGKDSHAQVNETDTGGGGLKYPLNFDNFLVRIFNITYIILHSGYIQWISDIAIVIYKTTRSKLKESSCRLNKLYFYRSFFCFKNTSVVLLESPLPLK
jgi:hypothetical protein